MTPREALKELEELVEFITRVDYVEIDLRNEVKELLIQKYRDSKIIFNQLNDLVAKAEPMKPTNLIIDIGYCPICENIVANEMNYCHNCGQKLDWGDE